VEKVDAYPWSSHHAYTGRNNPLALVDTDQILRLFSERESRARAKYREFMTDHDILDKTNVYATIDQRLLGDDEFVEWVMVQHDREEAQIRQKKKGLDEIAKYMRKDPRSYHAADAGYDAGGGGPGGVKGVGRH